MQRSTLVPALILMAAAPLAFAVPDADGTVTSTPAPDISADSAMKARLNYNVGFERFEKTQQLENAGAALKGAKARENQETVQAGYSEARERFRTVVAADPNLKEAWNLIGYTSRRLGEYEVSLAAYDTALKLAPDYPEAIEYRAELFVLTGKLEEAKAAYATLLKSSPSYAEVLKTTMQEWLASGAAAPGVGPAERNAFADWLKAQ